MSREIKYRAKRKDTGAFIYGWYVECPFGRWPVTPAIIDSELARSGHYEPVEIDAETLGQYTGLRDKNGKEIYEGDICKALLFVYEQFVEVYWDEDTLNFRVKSDHGTADFSCYHDDVENAVCGNIYENPELLKGEHERTD